MARFRLHTVDTRTGACAEGAEFDRLVDAIAAGRRLTRTQRRILVEDRETGGHHVVTVDGTGTRPVDGLRGTEADVDGAATEIGEGIKRGLAKLGVTPVQAATAVGLGVLRAGIAWAVFRAIVPPVPTRLTKEQKEAVQTTRRRSIATTAALVAVTAGTIFVPRLLAARSATT